MSKPTKSKLTIFDQQNYLRALETFPKEKGKCPEDTENFLGNILEVNQEADEAIIQNAINFTRSWTELGFSLPQRIMNKVLHAAFLFPAFIPQLSLLSDQYSDQSWLFNALLKLIRTQPELVLNSIRRNSSVWHFILKYFDEDFYAKSTEKEKKYNERDCSFLSEVLIFEWPQTDIETTISNNVKSICTFCVDLEGEVPEGILNCLAPLFPNETLSAIAGKVHKLNSSNLAYFYSLGLNTQPEFTGNNLIMAMKMFPKDAEIAEALASQLSEPEKALMEQMVKHYNPKTKHFTIE